MTGASVPYGKLARIEFHDMIGPCQRQPADLCPARPVKLQTRLMQAMQAQLAAYLAPAVLHNLSSADFESFWLTRQGASAPGGPVTKVDGT